MIKLTEWVEIILGDPGLPQVNIGFKNYNFFQDFLNSQATPGTTASYY